MPPMRRSMRRTARRTSRRTSRRQAAMMGAASSPDQEPMEAQPANSPAEEYDYTAELEKLAELRDKGILTEEEFQAKKAEILKSV